MKLIICTISVLMILLPRATSSSQETSPIEVFVQQDTQQNYLEIYFANPATGLSVVTTITNFTDDPFEALTLTANGVIFRDPDSQLPRLITPNGQIFDFSFIPQSPEPVTMIDWVLSPDRRRIAWAEIVFNSLGWQSTIYTALLDGRELQRLPDRPIEGIQATHRITMLGVSNDGTRVFFDAEFPPDQSTVFEGYQRVKAYVNRLQTYIDLPGEPNCLCPAYIANNGTLLLRLEPTAASFDLHQWNLEDNREVVFTGQDVPYPQAGNLMTDRDNTLALYMATDGEEYVTVLLDLTTFEERILSEPSEVPLRPVRFIDRNTAIVMIDPVEQITYKLRLDTGERSLVANKIWMGTIQE